MIGPVWPDPVGSCHGWQWSTAATQPALSGNNRPGVAWPCWVLPWLAVIEGCNSASPPRHEPAEHQFGVRHGLSGHWFSEQHKALLCQQNTCFTFRNLETSLAAWSHRRTGFALMVLYLIHPDHKDDRGCRKMSGMFPRYGAAWFPQKDQQPAWITLRHVVWFHK